MDDLLSKGSPYPKLTEEIKLLRYEMEINNRFMSKMLDYKESQLAGDNGFRDEWAESKKNSAKFNSFMLAIGAISLVIAATAFIIEMDESTKIMLMDRFYYWWSTV